LTDEIFGQILEKTNKVIKNMLTAIEIFDKVAKNALIPVVEEVARQALSSR